MPPGEDSGDEEMPQPSTPPKTAAKQTVTASATSVPVPGKNRPLIGSGSGTAEKTKPTRQRPRPVESTVPSSADSDNVGDVLDFGASKAGVSAMSAQDRRQATALNQVRKKREQGDYSNPLTTSRGSASSKRMASQAEQRTRVRDRTGGRGDLPLVSSGDKMMRVKYSQQQRLTGVPLDNTPAPQGTQMPTRLALQDGPLQNKIKNVETQIIERNTASKHKRSTFHVVVYKQDGKAIVPSYLALGDSDKYGDIKRQFKKMTFYNKTTRRYETMKNTNTTAQFSNVLTEWMSANGRQQGIMVKHKGPLPRQKLLEIMDIDLDYEP
jgi:hypothetical protein